MISILRTTFIRQPYAEKPMNLDPHDQLQWWLNKHYSSSKIISVQETFRDHETGSYLVTMQNKEKSGE